MTPAVDIVIPTLDGGDMLSACLEKIAGRDDVGVILVDNGSTDGSIERALERFPQVRVVSNDINRGYAPACNQGAAQATAPFVLFLNNDALLDPSQLQALLDAARPDDRTAIWQPVTYGTDGTLEATGDHFTWWGIFRHLGAPPATSGNVEVFSTVGAALLVRRSAFIELGGFEDSYFAYYEESDLCWRARLAGWNVKVVIEARVEHIGSSTTGQIFEPHSVRYLSFRNRIRTNLATPSASTLLRIVPAHLVACLGFVAFYLVTGRVRSAGAVVSAMWWPVGNRDVLAEQRARTQAIRKLPDAQVIRKELVSSFGPREIWRHLKRSYWFERAAARVSESTRRN